MLATVDGCCQIDTTLRDIGSGIQPEIGTLPPSLTLFYEFEESRHAKFLRNGSAMFCNDESYWIADGDESTSD